MRTLLGLLVIGTLAPAAPAQDRLGPDVRYWPLREISFPVPIDKIQAADPRPTKLRFYVAPDRGQFKKVAEKALADLDTIDSDKGKLKGFKYASPSDGEYDFALQFVYPDGDTLPRDDALKPTYRVVFDTRPPKVQIAPFGSTGVEWAVDDENPNADGAQVEVRWQGTTKWMPIGVRSFHLRDRYTWQNVTVNQPLEVRVVGKDKAGHEMASKVVTLPATGNSSGLSPFPGNVTSAPGGGGLDDTPNSRPPIEYVNTRGLTVESKLTRVTRSGVRKAYLWVNEGKGGWQKVKEQEVSITPSSADPTVRIPYSAAKDGLYGFIVIPENGAGGKQDDPRPNDPAQLLVQVDTEKPFVDVTGVRVSPGGLVGPRVEIEWQARDPNLMTDGIVLEYSENRTEWKAIAAKIPNTGRYVWEVDNKDVWKFYVRATAVDMAGNRGEAVYKTEVIVDLEKPAAVIDKVHGGPQTRDSERPATLPTVAPTTTVRPSAPAVTPTPGNFTPVTPPIAPTPPSESVGPTIPSLPGGN